MKLAVGICHRAVGYTRAYLDLANAIYTLGLQASVLDFESSDIPDQRNRIMAQAIERGDDALLFVDDDQIVTRDLLKRLLSHRRPVIGSTILTRSFVNCHIAAYRHEPNPDGSPWFRSINGGDIDRTAELVPVDAVGMGCTLIDLDVVRSTETLPGTWFQPTRLPDGRQLGEDISFCWRMRQAGHQVYVDPTVRVPHLILCALIPLPDGQGAFVDPSTSVAQADKARVTCGG